MATQEDLEKLKKTYKEAQKAWEKAKKAHVEAWQAYFKAKSKKTLYVAQKAREELNEVNTVYEKAMEEYARELDGLNDKLGEA